MRSTLYSLCITLFLFSSQVTTAQYCVNNLYFTGCIYNDEINDISVGSINQTGTDCGNNGYSDYTSLTSDFEQGGTFTLQVSCSNYGEYVSLWIDFDDDESFETSEKLVSYLYCSNAFQTYTSNFVIPYGAALGNHRMRVRCVQYQFPFDACTQYYNGEVHDYTANVTPPMAMSYVSSTTTQTETNNVSLGSSDVQIIGIQVVTSGSLSPINATSFTVNANGSTDFASDVTNAKIYYTGTDPGFSADNLFGSSVNLPTSITGNQQLAAGVNYFWLAYDINAAGTIDDVIDAECTSLTVAGTAYTPTLTAPAGNRKLGYCTPISTFSCYFAYIDGIQFNTLSNLYTYCNGNFNGYIEYAPVGNLTTTVEMGTSYPIILTGSFSTNEGFGVWIDFNNDGDFTDADEFVWASPFANIGEQTGTITIPNNAGYLGEHRMRIRCADYTTVSSSQSCSEFDYGEAEDYTITIGPSTPMVFVSSTTTQNNTTSVEKSTNDAEIIGVQVVTSGALNPFDITSLTINSFGSTDFDGDVSNVQVYYTGSSPVFATTTLFGSAADLSSPITGNLTLVAGTNYFWVAYDVSSGATIGDELDAECVEITMTGNGGTQIPIITAPTGSRQIDYCAPANMYGCYWGYIDGVVLNSLDNQFSGCNGNVNAYIQYDPIDYTTSLEAGGTSSISLTGGPTNEYVGFGVWIDFNNDGDFTDAGEFAWSSPFATPGTQTGLISVPVDATIGEHRMRIRSKDYSIVFASEYCGETYYNGESEDYTISITAPSAMTYVSSTVIQDNLDPITAGDTDQEIIGIQLLTSGSLSPFDATSFQLNANGSSDFANDVTNVKIYYTGSTPVFSTGTLFGSSTDISIPITGSQTLTGGANYFWVTYDIAGAATLGNFLDAECENIVMNGGVGTQIPSVTAPAGNRTITYCVGAYQYGCTYAYINGVTFNTLVNTNTFCNGNPDGYILYPQSGNTTTELELGNSYDLQLEGGFYSYLGFGVWIDFNGNGGFDDPGEFVYGSPYIAFGTQYATINLPCDEAFVGDRRMRVRASYYNLLADSQSCSTLYDGETEDYIITLSPPSANQTYTSSSCEQPNLTNIPAGAIDAEILRIQVSATGCISPLNIASFTLNEIGTTDFANDVTNVKIYYTGTDPNFSPVNLFGSATDLSSPITGSQALNAGINYFWVAYDISPNATLGNYADAECSQVEITGAGNYTPINSAPFGSRQINLCVPTLIGNCFYGNYINNVTLNTLSNLFTGCNGALNSYIYYAPSGNLTTSVQAGFSYNITLDAGYSPMGFGVWIDFNNNSDFGDPGEFVYGSTSYGYSYTGTISVPIDPSFYGLRRMRIRGVNYSILGAQDYCSNIFYSGETEDYMITVEAPLACVGTPDPGTISVEPFIVCSAGNTVDMVLSGYTPAGDLAFQWQQSTDDVIWSNIFGETSTSYSATVNSSLYYRVEVTCLNTGDFSNSPSAYVQLGGTEAITSTTGATICGEDTTSITAAGTGTYVMWYDSPTSQSPLYYSNSPSSYTPYVAATTTYYASSADGSINTGSVGPVDNSIGPTNQYYTGVFQYFDVYKPCTISGVYVYPAAAGNVILFLADQFWFQMKVDTFVATAADVNQKTFVPLDWFVDVGTDYHLGLQYGSVNLLSNEYNYIPYDYPYTLDNVISITESYYGTYYYFYAYDWVINYSTLCESAREPVTVTVTPSPEVTITTDPLNPTICEGSGQLVSMTASGGGYNSFIWSPADGLSETTGAAVSASPASSTQYLMKASDGTCVNYDTVLVTVAPMPVVTATATPDAVCAGGTSQLLASSPATSYSMYTIPFAPDQTNGGTVLAISDNQVMNNLPLGFTFNFYGSDYTEFTLSSNGWLSFDYQNFADCCQGQFLPDPNIPNNLIAFAWEDLNPPNGGTVRYYTTGSAPFRRCVIEFEDVPHYYSGDPVTAQVILYESTNIIDIVTTSMPGNPSGYYGWAPHTMGIENKDGTAALTVPGRNADATWTAANETWRFAPEQFNYTWAPSGTLDNATVINPLATPSGTTTYTVTVTNPVTSCATDVPVTVNVVTTPVAGTVTPDYTEFCGNGSAILNATGYSPGAIIQWQESATSGGRYSDIPGATGSSYTTPSINTTTYYVTTVTCTNSSTSAEGTVAVSQAPDPPIAIDGVNCGPGIMEIGAIGSGTGELNWFYSPSGDNYIGSGSPFTTPFVSQTTTFYVQEGGNPAAAPLATTFFGSSLANGNMFDITAVNDVFITGFDVNMAINYYSDFEVYYKVGTFLGSEYQPQNWTLLGTAVGVQGLGAGAITPLPLSLYLHVPAGQTVGIYITANNYYSYTNSSFGTTVGNVYAQDDNLQVKEGYYFYYPFSYGYGPYVWNGRVHYVAPGCASALTPVLAEVTAPQVVATASIPTICQGDPVTLTAVNLGVQTFNFEWSPQLPGMNPQNGLDDTVTVSPPVTTTFTVSITDPNAPLCDTVITVDVTVNPTPGVFISGLDPQYYDNVTSVTMLGVPAGGTFSGPGVTGNVFNPSAVGPGTYTITYTFTDASGCTGTNEQTVIVIQYTGIGNAAIDQSIMLFPNPSEGLFNMSMKLPSSAQNVIVTIYDPIGRQVFNYDYGAIQQDLQSTFDFSQNSKGSYYLTINVDGQLFYRKLTIQ